MMTLSNTEIYRNQLFDKTNSYNIQLQAFHDEHSEVVSWKTQSGKEKVLLYGKRIPTTVV